MFLFGHLALNTLGFFEPSAARGQVAGTPASTALLQQNWQQQTRVYHMRVREKAFVVNWREDAQGCALDRGTAPVPWGASMLSGRCRPSTVPSRSSVCSLPPTTEFPTKNLMQAMNTYSLFWRTLSAHLLISVVATNLQQYAPRAIRSLFLSLAHSSASTFFFLLSTHPKYFTADRTRYYDDYAIISYSFFSEYRPYSFLV